VSQVELAEEARMRPQPLISVADVEASSRWYQRLLGCESAHGGKEYERLARDGVLILQLHNRAVEHHHGPIGDPTRPYGNGLLLWFEIDDFDTAVARVDELKAEIVMAPYDHTGASQREVWLRDLDGYVVVLSCPYGEAGPSS
jgi:catechol 2,3-dioxygenase-like lactoylglutathione lyase family enzyme